MNVKHYAPILGPQHLGRGKIGKKKMPLVSAERTAHGLSREELRRIILELIG
jgi:hypothetical protein